MCTTTQWLTVLSRCFIESSDDIIIIIFADIDFQVLISSSSSSSCPPQRKWRVIKLLLLTESVTFQPKLSKTYCSVCRYEIQWRRVSCQKVGMKSGKLFHKLYSTSLSAPNTLEATTWGKRFSIVWVELYTFTKNQITKFALSIPRLERFCPVYLLLDRLHKDTLQDFTLWISKGVVLVLFLYKCFAT